jgi:hypothetical protein
MICIFLEHKVLCSFFFPRIYIIYLETLAFSKEELLPKKPNFQLKLIYSQKHFSFNLQIAHQPFESYYIAKELLMRFAKFENLNFKLLIKPYNRMFKAPQNEKKFDILTKFDVGV